MGCKNPRLCQNGLPAVTMWRVLTRQATSSHIVPDYRVQSHKNEVARLNPPPVLSQATMLPRISVNAYFCGTVLRYSLSTTHHWYKHGSNKRRRVGFPIVRHPTTRTHDSRPLQSHFLLGASCSCSGTWQHLFYFVHRKGEGGGIGGGKISATAFAPLEGRGKGVRNVSVRRFRGKCAKGGDTAVERSFPHLNCKGEKYNADSAPEVRSGWRHLSRGWGGGGPRSQRGREESVNASPRLRKEGIAAGSIIRGNDNFPIASFPHTVPPATVVLIR